LATCVDRKERENRTKTKVAHKTVKYSDFAKRIAIQDANFCRVNSYAEASRNDITQA